MKVTRNFSFAKLVESPALSEWLNQYGNRINQSIQKGLQTGTDIYGNKFEPGGDFTHRSVQDGHAHKRPLIRSGRLQNSVKKLPATLTKLSFTIKSKVKSKKRWNIEIDGKKSKGTRTAMGINYGAMHNQGVKIAYKTSDKSLIPNKTVPSRIWFGISPKFLVGGSEWNIMVDLLQSYLQKYVKTSMKEFK